MPNRLARTLLLVSMLGAILASTGCIEFERAITLNKDLSGKARFRATMNMEPMARFAAQMEKGGAPPTDDEVAAAVRELLADLPTQPMADPKSQVAVSPQGFTLVDATHKLDGLKVTIDITVGFEDIRKLSTLKLVDPSPRASADTLAQPFEDVDVKDEGQTILITAKLMITGDTKMMAPPTASNAASDPATAQGFTEAMNQIASRMGGDEAVMKQLRAIVKDMKETFRFETPMTIVETNATKRETGAVVWEQSFDEIDKARTASPDWKSPGISVRVRK